MAKRAFTDSSRMDVELFKRSKESIAQGALTNSKRPQCFVQGVYPTHLSRAVGPYVWDTRGNIYIDFICGLGTSLLGYSHDEVDRAVVDRIKRGMTLSLGTDLEVEVAEKVKEIFPFVERVRFLKTGSEACTAAVRVARASTKRAVILSDGYHGFHDPFVSLTPPAIGVVPHPQILKFEDLSQINESVAAVILEPIITDASPARIQYLRQLRARCTDTGTLLIFDEIITGFRFPKFSVSNYHGIEPDLICLGKAIANGMPLSVVGGRQKTMECDEYFISSTFAGETLSLAAGLKTMTLLQKKYQLDHLWEMGTKFLTRFNSFWPGIQIAGYPTRGVFQADIATKALFFQEACRAGILVGSSFFFNFAHIDVMDSVLQSFQDIITRIKTNSVKLEGEIPQTPFAQQIREKMYERL